MVLKTSRGKQSFSFSKSRYLMQLWRKVWLTRLSKVVNSSVVSTCPLHSLATSLARFRKRISNGFCKPSSITRIPSIVTVKTTTSARHYHYTWAISAKGLSSTVIAWSLPLTSISRLGKLYLISWPSWLLSSMIIRRWRAALRIFKSVPSFTMTSPWGARLHKGIKSWSMMWYWLLEARYATLKQTCSENCHLFKSSWTRLIWGSNKNLLPRFFARESSATHQSLWKKVFTVWCKWYLSSTLSLFWTQEHKNYKPRLKPCKSFKWYGRWQVLLWELTLSMKPSSSSVRSFLLSSRCLSCQHNLCSIERSIKSTVHCFMRLTKLASSMLNRELGWGN